jgi:hypothetical protein
MSKEKQIAELESEELDVQKREKRRTDALSESIRRSSETTAEALSGTADAVAKAFASFRDELDIENVSRAGLINGFIEGIFAGGASFFEGMAKTSKHILEDLKSSDSGSRKSSEVIIDYEHLARLVANEMMKGEHNKETKQ